MSTTPQKPTAVHADGLVTVSEPLEGAFTILMPKGWTNQVHLQREHSLNRAIVSAVSPDQATHIYLGDPRVPIFIAPGPYVDPFILQFSPHIRMQPYTPADTFVRDYVQQCFGAAPGFRITDTAEAPEFLRAAMSSQPPSRASAAALTFEHHGPGPLLRCRAFGATLEMHPMWAVELSLVSTTGDLEYYSRLALRILASRRPDPAWMAAQKQRAAQEKQFANSMAEIQRRGHEQRMRDIHNFGATNTRMHNERMAQMDTNHQAWMAGQTQSDASHRAWMDQQTRDDEIQQARVNAIREEHTVVDSSGMTYQVDSHHERYFVNRRDNTYIGADGATGLADLQRTHGVNPRDYEEVKIVR